MYGTNEWALAYIYGGTAPPPPSNKDIYKFVPVMIDLTLIERVTNELTQLLVSVPYRKPSRQQIVFFAVSFVNVHAHYLFSLCNVLWKKDKAATFYSNCVGTCFYIVIFC